MAGKYRGNGDGKRRTKGTGTVVQTPSGKYIGQAMILGKRRSTVVCRTEREAEKALREMLGNADQGILPPKDKLTVAQWLDRWLEFIAPQKLRPETLKSYALQIRVHLKPTLGHIRLADLQRAHVREWHVNLAKRGLKPATVQRIHGVLSGSLQDALEDNLVMRNVARGIELPGRKRRQMRTLDAQQARALLTEARGTRWEALLAVAVYTGMRIGEILALRWRDVDLGKRTIRVEHSLTRSKVIGETKTAAGRRTISLPEPCIEALRAHRARQAEERLAAGETWQDNGLVFCTGRIGRSKTSVTYPDSPLTARCVQNAYKNLLAKAGLPQMRLHDMRHASATLMLSSGVPVKVVSERLGHSKTAVTLDTYAHVLPEQDRDAADRIAALLG